jgi:hypothetical protein
MHALKFNTTGGKHRKPYFGRVPVELDVLNWSVVRRNQCAVSLENGNRARAIIISAFGMVNISSSYGKTSTPTWCRQEWQDIGTLRVSASQNDRHTVELTNPGARPQ